MCEKASYCTSHGVLGVIMSALCVEGGGIRAMHGLVCVYICVICDRTCVHVPLRIHVDV